MSKRMSAQRLSVPEPCAEFWQLPLPEQVRLAMPYTRRTVTQADVEVLVGRLVNYAEPNHAYEDVIANLIHGGRAFGHAEFIRRHKGRGEDYWHRLACRDAD